MENIIDHLSVAMPLFLISWSVFFVSTLWKPQKFRNSIFLMTALFFTAFFVAALAGAYMGTVLLVSFLLAFLALLCASSIIEVCEDDLERPETGITRHKQTDDPER